MVNIVPKIAFLGVANYAEFQELNNLKLATRIDRVYMTITCPIYPLPIGGLPLLFSYYLNEGETNEKYRIEIIDSKSKIIMFFEVEMKIANAIGQDITGWTPISLLLFPEGTLIEEPGTYRLRLVGESGIIPLGALEYRYEKYPELTEERINAIKANPFAYKSVRLVIGCKLCNDKKIAFASIFGREDPKDKEGSIWYQDLPDKFTCKCGNIINLYYVKENMHALIGNRIQLQNTTGSFLYTSQEIKFILSKFKELLDKNPKEEEIQQFLKNNPLLFAVFSPKTIIPKAKILTANVTDFVIINPKNELILIEIEPADIGMVKQDGGTHHQLQHAKDQVHDWISKINDHKSATLSELDLNINEISKIKGIVIAGRTASIPQEFIKKFRTKDTGEIEIYTFDDLIESVEALVKNQENSYLRQG